MLVKIMIHCPFTKEQKTQTLLSNGRYFTIGREMGDIVLKDSACSQTHAMLCVSQTSRLVLKDLSSTTGTLVNNRHIEKANLSAGDTIRIGKTLITIVEILPHETRYPLTPKVTPLLGIQLA